MEELFGQIVGFRAQLELLVDILAKKGLLSDEDAVQLPLLFRVWKPGTREDPADYPDDGTILRCPFDGNLYRVKEGMGHKCYGDENYAPSRYHAAWEPVANPGEDGSREHPYSFVQGMKLEEGKYYRQNGVLYRCILGVAWLYDDLENVVGHYVEVVA